MWRGNWYIFAYPNKTKIEKNRQPSNNTFTTSTKTKVIEIT